MTIESAKRHVMAALTFSLGHYVHNLLPTGWIDLHYGVVEPEQPAESTAAER